MEIRVLRYFLAIAREGSITNAANFLHVTQPTLSRQIRDSGGRTGAKTFHPRQPQHDVDPGGHDFAQTRRRNRLYG